VVETSTRELLVLGDRLAAEFAELTRALQRSSAIRYVDDVQDADAPVAILALATTSGCFAPREIDVLRHQFPLATIWLVYGPWCYGEQRTGNPSSGVIRLPWYVWNYRLPYLLKQGGLACETASVQERLEIQLADIASVSPSPSVSVWAENVEDSRCIESAFRVWGGATHWYDGQSSDGSAASDVAVAMVSQRAGTAQAAAEQFFAQQATATRIACVASPTMEDWNWARRSGCVAILGQPFDLRDLYALATGDLWNVVESG